MTETAELCGICGADHEGRCPGTESPAPYVDTRPRYPYRLADGRVVQVIHDVGEQPRPTITFDLGGGNIVDAALCSEYERVMAESAADDVRRRDSLIALLHACSDAAASGALRHASLQIFGDDVADVLEAWAESRGAAVEHDILTANLPSGRTAWRIIKVSLSVGTTITAHRNIYVAHS